jgi:UDP-N-acetylmuramyl pentapeptide phosphotransferase/UDP-N-acetylglucosamine-1-phosphate transferase
LLPVFGAGLVEDFTRRVGAGMRWFFAVVSAALGWWLLDAGLFRLDIQFVDNWLLGYPWLAFALTLLAVAGVSHAANIMDGCNGLSGFICSLALALIGVVALLVDDQLVAKAAFVTVGAVGGFMLWNFPHGRIFLGDAGAYTLGFVVAELSVLLVARNPGVSAWFPLLLMLYPVWETLFSMLRRARNGMAHITRPDALHLHHLILRRVVRFAEGRHRQAHGKVMRNSAAAAYAGFLAVLCAVPALLFWNNAPALMLSCALFVGLYVRLYGAIVRFRVPRLLLVSAGRGSARREDAVDMLDPDGGDSSWSPK